MATRPTIGWLEVHPENYFGHEGPQRMLDALRNEYPLSLHGVSLSLGSMTDLDMPHVAQLMRLIERLDPFLVSEHLSWSRADDAHFNELLPLPYTEEALDNMVRHIDQAQSLLGRQLLIENPSSYLRYRHSTISEAGFLAALVQRTGCGILLDVNNLYVSAHNVGLDVHDYLSQLPAAAIGEIHVAGHARVQFDTDVVLIDDHGSRVSEDVWDLYGAAVERFGPRPTLVEWDNALPTLDVLLSEAARADTLTSGARLACHADAA